MSKPTFSFNFDVKRRLDSIVSVSTYVPENSFSTELLGTERTGHGVVIGNEDLIVTIGYVLTEAETIWITANDSEPVQGYIVGNDYESGLGLIKPVTPLNIPGLECGYVSDLEPGDSVLIAGHGGLGHMVESEVMDIKEFSGRWEYIQDNAIFTSPVHPNWAGAALIGNEGSLYGIGCLLIQNVESSDRLDGENMFVPIDSILPHIEEISRFGARKKKPHPWLGMLVQEEDSELVVTGIFTGCPADKAGLKLGDRILSVAHQPVSSLSSLFRNIWCLGDAGITVPLKIVRKDNEIDLSVISSDRDSCFRRGPIN